MTSHRDCDSAFGGGFGIPRGLWTGWIWETFLCRSKLNGRIYFAGRFFRVFGGGQNNCYFDSAVKNTNMLQNKFLQHRLVLTGTII